MREDDGTKPCDSMEVACCQAAASRLRTKGAILFIRGSAVCWTVSTDWLTRSTTNMRRPNNRTIPSRRCAETALAKAKGSPRRTCRSRQATHKDGRPSHALRLCARSLERRQGIQSRHPYYGGIAVGIRWLVNRGRRGRSQLLHSLCQCKSQVSTPQDRHAKPSLPRRTTRPRREEKPHMRPDASLGIRILQVH